MAAPHAVPLERDEASNSVMRTSRTSAKWAAFAALIVASSQACSASKPGGASPPDGADAGQDGSSSEGGTDDHPPDADTADSTGAESENPAPDAAVEDAESQQEGSIDEASSTDSPAGADAEDSGDEADSNACAAGELACGSGCVANGVKNCGSCGNDCTNLSHVIGKTSCTGGQCSLPATSCDVGWADCDGRADNGCETDVTQAAHCGSCNNLCTGAMPVCAGSGTNYACFPKCPTATPTQCGSACVDISSDAKNCGACGNACATTVSHGQPVCDAGSCWFLCNAGYTACGDNGGICVDEQTDSSHCGGCSIACAGGKTCQIGSCVCPAGMVDCSGVCKSNAVGNPCGSTNVNACIWLSPDGKTYPNASAPDAGVAVQNPNNNADETSPKVVLFFWGAYWTNPTGSADSLGVLNSVVTMLDTPSFWARYAQYGFSSGSVDPLQHVSDTNLSTPRTLADVADIQTRLGANALACPGTDCINVILLPPSVVADRGTYHDAFMSAGQTYVYAVIEYTPNAPGDASGESWLVSREVMEAATDPLHWANAWISPHPTASEIAASNGSTQGTPEIGDLCDGWNLVYTPAGGQNVIGTRASSGLRVQQSWLQDQCRCDGAQTVGIFRPAQSSQTQTQWFLSNSNVANRTDIGPFSYGQGGDIAIVGDWDGNGTTTVGIFRPVGSPLNPGNEAQWFLNNSNIANHTDVGPFNYGNAGDIPIVGDWDGDGTTTVGIFRPAGSPFNSGTEAQWFLSNSNIADHTDVGPFNYGIAGDLPVVGDWDGNGTTTVGIFRPAASQNGQAQWFLSNSNVADNTDIGPLYYGNFGDLPVVGDWDGNAVTTIGIFRPVGTVYNSNNQAQWFLNNKNIANNTDVGPFSYGNAGDLPVVGRWTNQ